MLYRRQSTLMQKDDNLRSRGADGVVMAFRRSAVMRLMSLLNGRHRLTRCRIDQWRQALKSIRWVSQLSDQTSRTEAEERAAN
jgi:hypothetical protein